MAEEDNASKPQKLSWVEGPVSAAERKARLSWLPETKNRGFTDRQNQSNLKHVRKFLFNQKPRILRTHDLSCKAVVGNQGDGRKTTNVLLGQRRSICEHVSLGRYRSVRSFVNETLQHKEALERAWDASDHDGNGLLDEDEFKQALSMVIQELFQEDIDDAEMFALLAFVLVSTGGTVEKDQMLVLSAMHKVRKLMGQEWKDKLSGDMSMENILVLLKDLNEGLKVRKKEANWILDMATTFVHQSELDHEETLLMAIAYWYCSPKASSKRGLLRQPLLDRLNLEKDLKSGFCPLLLYIALFFLLGYVRDIAGMAHKCRGIKDNLSSQYGLDDLAESITALSGVKEYLQEYSIASAPLSPLSAEYFGGGSIYMILEDETEFTAPEPLATVDFWFAKEFTFQAWIKYDSRVRIPAGGMPILRKRMASGGALSALSCWSWNFPDALSWGAHDYGGALADPVTGRLEDYLPAGYSPTIYPETLDLVMHTVSISTSATGISLVNFMVGAGQIIGTPDVQMRRPLTDCNRNDVQIGSNGLTLASVRFFPKALNPTEVAELYEQGATLNDIGYVIAMSIVPPISQIERLALTVQQQLSDQREVLANSESIIEGYAVLTAEAARNPGVETPPLITTNHTILFENSDSVFPSDAAWVIYDTPVYTSKSSINEAPGNALPLSPNGFTISTWLKMHVGTDQGYHVARARPDRIVNGSWIIDGGGWGNNCWLWYIGGTWTSIHTRTTQSGAGGAGPSFYLYETAGQADWVPEGRSWRHWVMQIDPTPNAAHPLRICIDADCYDGTAGEPAGLTLLENQANGPPSADCQQVAGVAQNLLDADRVFLNGRAPGVWMMQGWQMSTKYYNRVLSQSEISTLWANDPVPGSPTQKIRSTYGDMGGCKLPTEKSDNPNFLDDFGHNCYWYFTLGSLRETLCSRAPSAAANCLMACNSAETCWGSVVESGNEMYIWTQQMEFRSVNEYGTFCVGSSTTAVAEAIRCGSTIVAHSGVNCTQLTEGLTAQYLPLQLQDCSPTDCSAHSSDMPMLLTCLGNKQHWTSSEARQDYFVRCRAIVEGYEPSCTWDDSGLDVVAADIAIKKTWSISVWFEVLEDRDCLQPQIRLLDGTSGNTFSWVGGLEEFIYDSSTAAGCNAGSYLSHGMIAKMSTGGQCLPEADVDQSLKPKPGEKVLLTFGRYNDASLGAAGTGRIGIQYNTGANTDNANADVNMDPIAPNKDFLRVINVAGNLRVGTMVLRSFYPQTGDLSYLQYQQVALELDKFGPVDTLARQLNKLNARDVGTFTQKSMLIAPPMLLQERRMAGECASENADNVVQAFFQRGNSYQCTGPYDCGSYAPETVYKCPGDVDDGVFFGESPIEYDNKKVYMEYLAAIANTKVLARAGQPMMTEDFLSTLTSEVQILSVFYSVEFGITTQLIITFDTTQGKVNVERDIRHYTALTGDDLTKFHVAMICVCVVTLLLMVNNISGLWVQILTTKLKGFLIPGNYFVLILDWFIFGMTIIFIAMYWIEKSDSNETAERVIGKLVNLPWSATVSGAQKKSEFLDAYKDMADSLSWSRGLDVFGVYLALVHLLRMLLATSMHPRIALVNATLKVAASDFFHFTLLFILIFWGFAVIGCYWFSAEREDFRNVHSTMRTQMDCLLDPPGVIDATNVLAGAKFEFLLYAILFHTMCFLLMLNFILAILLDAYSHVAHTITNMKVDMDLARDFIVTIMTSYRSMKFGWPRQYRIIQQIMMNKNKYVTPPELIGAGFANLASAEAFYYFYQNFDAIIYDDEDDNLTEDIQSVADGMNSTLHKIDRLQWDMWNMHSSGDEDSAAKMVRPTMVSRRK